MLLVAIFKDFLLLNEIIQKKWINFEKVVDFEKDDVTTWRTERLIFESVRYFLEFLRYISEYGGQQAPARQHWWGGRSWRRWEILRRRCKRLWIPVGLGKADPTIEQGVFPRSDKLPARTDS